MRNLQDYITRYSQVAGRLGYTGESVDLLIQLLAQASYISEVENVTYMTEASIDKANLMNSKIQHCVDVMYSVFRGSCPRVIMKIRPTKYLDFNLYDTIITSNNFTVHYLGWYKYNSEHKEINWNTDPTIIYPALGVDEEPDGDGEWYNDGGKWYNKEDEYYILGFIAPKRVGENLILEGAGKDGVVTIDYKNTYYVECIADNLSDDMYIEIVQDNGDATRLPRTRIFANHILENHVFDLTLPGYGSRVYIANYFKDNIPRDSRNIEGVPENTKVRAQFYGFSNLGDYNQAELKRAQLKGAELLPFGDDFPSYNDTDWNTGIYYIPSVPRDELNTVHYKANRERYTSSIVRSNSDIGVLLEEWKPTKVTSGGTSYFFTSISNSNRASSLNLYYIPKTDGQYLTEEEIKEFISNRLAYYVTSNITVSPGIKYIANFNIDLEVYKNSLDDWNVEIGEKILTSMFAKKFNVSFSDMKEVESLISKNTNIKKVLSMDITFTDEGGRTVDISELDPKTTYYQVKYSITSSVKI